MTVHPYDILPSYYYGSCHISGLFGGKQSVKHHKSRPYFRNSYKGVRMTDDQYDRQIYVSCTCHIFPASGLNFGGNEGVKHHKSRPCFRNSDKVFRKTDDLYDRQIYVSPCSYHILSCLDGGNENVIHHKSGPSQFGNQYKSLGNPYDPYDNSPSYNGSCHMLFHTP